MTRKVSSISRTASQQPVLMFLAVNTKPNLELWPSLQTKKIITKLDPRMVTKTTTTRTQMTSKNLNLKTLAVSRVILAQNYQPKTIKDDNRQLWNDLNRMRMKVPRCWRVTWANVSVSWTKIAKWPQMGFKSSKIVNFLVSTALLTILHKKFFSIITI